MPDRLELRIGPTYDGSCCGDTVDLFINDQNLIEIVSELELPWIAKQRLNAAEDCYETKYAFAEDIERVGGCQHNVQ